MKYRRDFVTNSSSSSYVCEICGRTESGFDLGLNDVEMFRCVNDHVACTEHMVDVSKEDMIKELVDCECYEYTREQLENMSADELRSVFNIYEMPEIFCPICQFVEYSESDMADYLLKEYKVPRSEAFEDIKKANKRRKKLYNYEYVFYVCNKLGLNHAEIQASWKEKFKTYEAFASYLRKA